MAARSDLDILSPPPLVRLGSNVSSPPPSADHSNTVEAQLKLSGERGLPAPSTLDALFAALDWPNPEDVWRPNGPAAHALAHSAREKIQQPLRRSTGIAEIQVGVITEDPGAPDTQALLALVCAFPQPASSSAIRHAHSLAWNFNRSKILITIEPHLIRSWTCWERPSFQQQDLPTPVLSSNWDPSTALENAAIRALHIAYLASGAFVERHPDRFDFNQRADQLLLRNLSALRSKLLSANLTTDIAHDLIGRLIFIQFLYQREDSLGNPALSPAVLTDLYEQGVLTKQARNLTEVLNSHADTYLLFRWLNDHFNGDLFPGKGTTAGERAAEWQAEMSSVTDEHLRTLADFANGDLAFDNGQRSLWPLYSFNAIPLEIISSIYEKFVSESPDSVGAHYTPSFLVDFILDRALPWNGERTDIKVLDPSCGSGIFLVKAFQRLVARWRFQNAGSEPPISFLVGLLESQLFGIDINPHAIRVASFSLYLALCEEIDPRSLWRDVRFPRLRDRTLLTRDYFRQAETPVADLIIGNVPWGKNSMTEAATDWAKQQRWPIDRGHIGPLFLAKAATELSENGRISLLQPASTVLVNRGKRAKTFREALLSRLRIQEIVDFSSFRFGLFANSSSPICLVTACQGATETSFHYTRPKPDQEPQEASHIQVEASDVHELLAVDLIEEPWIISALSWGSGRGMAILRRLIRETERRQLLTLGDLRRRDGWLGREGFKRGKKSKTKFKPYLAQGRHSLIDVWHLGKGRIMGTPALNDDPYFHDRDSTDDRIYTGPLLLIGKGWSKEGGFHSAVFNGPAVFPASSVYGLRFPSIESGPAQAACCIVNSRFAEWFLTLVSGRASSYRPEVALDDLMKLPIGIPERVFEYNGSCSDCNFDSSAEKLLELKPSEWVIVEEFVDIYLRDFRSPAERRGRSRPHDSDLKEYCDYFLRVLAAGVGAASACATIFRPPSDSGLQIRVVAIHLGHVPNQDRITLVEVGHESKLLVLLRKLSTRQQRAISPSMRIFDIYESFSLAKPVPTVYLVKPDFLRYWTRTCGMDDADATIADLLHWNRPAAEAAGEAGTAQHS